MTYLKLQLSDSLYGFIVENTRGQALNGLWAILNSLGLDLPYPERVECNFVLKRQLFFNILQKLMRDDKVRLAKNGIFLIGSIEEQIALFEKAFPISEEAMDSGIWFFDVECLAGAVWVYQLEDGLEYLEWT
jgi:hypothetical protein